MLVVSKLSKTSLADLLWKVQPSWTDPIHPQIYCQKTWMGRLCRVSQLEGIFSTDVQCRLWQSNCCIFEPVRWAGSSVWRRFWERFNLVLSSFKDSLWKRVNVFENRDVSRVALHRLRNLQSRKENMFSKFAQIDNAHPIQPQTHSHQYSCKTTRLTQFYFNRYLHACYSTQYTVVVPMQFSFIALLS